jgi:hypothetical protein
MAAYDSLHSLLDYECPLFILWRIPYNWILLNWTNFQARSPSPTFPTLLCFIRCHGNMCLASRWLLMDFLVCLLLREGAFGEPLASNGLPLLFHYSDFQASCHNNFNIVFPSITSLPKWPLLFVIETVSQSLCLCVEIFNPVWQLRSCFCGAPSLKRGWVCLFYMLLALASAVFVGSYSLGTGDHILLSHIWDFPLCHLLRLAGSQWRYSTTPPHGGYCWLLIILV